MKTNKHKAIKIGAVALAGAVLCGALVYYNFIDEETTGAMLNEKCPDFTIKTFEVQDDKFVISDETFTLSEHVGEKVIVLNFWATYCQPCKVEIPHFNEFQENYDGQVEVVIINGETSGTAQDLLDKHINNPDDQSYTPYYSTWTEFSCTFARYENDDNVKKLFDVGDALPVTIVVDRQGIIKYIGEAAMTYSELENVVLKLL